MTPLAKLVARSAQTQPQRVAVRAVDGSITYAELDELAEALALRLLDAGVEAGHRVGLWLEKSILAVACMQACLRLGAVYVPLDPLSPSPRVNAIARDADMRVVVSDPSRAAALECSSMVLEYGEHEWRALLHGDRLELRVEVEPTALAYILYTSGSTGVPKGVCISHRNALAFVEWAVETLALGPEDRLCSHAPLHFDLSVLDLYGAFAVGATVCLMTELSANAPAQLVAFGRNHQISVWYSVPSALIMMMSEGALLDIDDWRPRVLCFAGEVFPIGPLRTLRDHWPDTRFFNLYGPTETNVCTFYEVVGPIPEARMTPVPIGRASCGDEVWVETEAGHRAGVGESGELIVAGPTVMLGYWGRQAQQGPYRTGDIVRVEDDGNLYFLGRRDHMVKVRGHRIELGEIEATLAAHPGVAEVAVIVEGEGLEAKLVACVVAAGAQVPGLLGLKRQCAERLPHYMIIDRVRVLEQMPRTRNGKIDRAALRA